MCLMLLLATFQFTIVNFKKLYFLGFLLNRSEKDIDGKLTKSAFTWIKLEVIGCNRLGDMWQTVQHMQVEIVSAAFGKWLHLTYHPLT